MPPEVTITDDAFREKVPVTCRELCSPRATLVSSSTSPSTPQTDPFSITRLVAR